MPALDPTHLAAASALAAGWGTHATALGHRLRRARRDPLTGLHTREVFTRRAARILHRGPALVVLIDLDHFKPLNDTHGHAAGDAVLAATGARLTTWAKGRGTAARLGGDEFAAVITSTDPPRDLDTLHHALTSPVTWASQDGGGVLSMGASIGAHPVTAGASLDVALARADAAMYTAKTCGGGWHQAEPGSPASLPGAPRRWKRTRPERTRS
jgi:diguanylate cyclase (GGDEF)-like protein